MSKHTIVTPGGVTRRIRVDHGQAVAGLDADIMIRPRLSDIAGMDFHRADPAITEGQRAAEQTLPELREFLGA